MNKIFIIATAMLNNIACQSYINLYEESEIDNHTEEENIDNSLWIPPVWTADDHVLAEIFADAVDAATGYYYYPKITSGSEYHIKWSEDCGGLNEETGFVKWYGMHQAFPSGKEKIEICYLLLDHEPTFRLTVAHELGHHYGLGHTNKNTDSIMHRKTTFGINHKKQFLTEYDLQNVTKYNLSFFALNFE